MVGKASHLFVTALYAVLAAAGTIDKRIIGAENATENEFPSIVSIQNAGSHICGGSLLDNTTVLTAAHCTFSSNPMGTGRYSDPQTGGVVAAVASITIHPAYTSRKGKKISYRVNDVAIIKLLTPIGESENIRFATLPPDGWTPAANSTAIAAGWGVQNVRQDVAATTLAKVLIPIRPVQDCAAFSETEATICAGAAGKDTAEGDSGGPLIDPNTGHLIAVTLAGSLESFRGVYAKTSSYIPFINENLGWTEQSTQSPKPLGQQVEEHCGRCGNDKAACLEAAARCKAEVKPDAVVPLHLECIDRLQACNGSKIEACMAYAKECQYRHEFPLRDLVQLVECIESADEEVRDLDEFENEFFGGVSGKDA
ncbi:Trypsin [Beauveria bassiana]|uniref:Trypsin n=1 Tax=Beauveria bassiana TaxID=176275 RepID=A0A2N6NUU3_BEABA|nr:Trypsin [Beauveria bassiana]